MTHTPHRTAPARTPAAAPTAPALLGRRPGAWELGALLGACLAEHRTEPLRELARGPLSVGRLADLLDLDIRTLSKQLQVMLGLGLLEREHRGTERLYRLSRRVTLERHGREVHLSLACSAAAGSARVALIVLENEPDTAPPRDDRPAASLSPGPAHPAGSIAAGTPRAALPPVASRPAPPLHHAR